MAYMSMPFTRDGEFVYHRGLRYEHALRAGVGDKALLVLSVGRGDGATIPRELRRQLHWTRYTYPDMPGIAFFGSPIKYDLKTDQQLYNFYINPVLRVEPSEDGRIRVTNIGGDHAPATNIKVSVGADEVTVRIPPLKVKEARTFDLEPNGAKVEPISEYRPGLYILGPPPLWNAEPAHLRPGALAAWPEPGPVAASGRDLLEREPSKGDVKESDDDSAAEPPPLYYDIADTEGRSFQLAYTLRPTGIGNGSEIVVRLDDRETDSRLELAMRNNGQIHGRGSPGWSLLRIRNEQGLEPEEYLALGLKAGIDYRYKLHYDASGYVRVAIHDENDNKLWDSGKVPTYGEMRFDKISFVANRVADWQPDEKAIDLKGGSWQGAFAGRVSEVDLDIYEK